jgi:ubiquinone/menaquinone biosynthesis C-methylase UbiE
MRFLILRLTFFVSFSKLIISNAEVSLLQRFIHRFAANPRIYDLIQCIAGSGKIYQNLIPYLAQAENLIVLDIGAGTGNLTTILPRSAKYIWMDCDTKKLEGFKAKKLPGLVILGDATKIPLKDKSVDYAICIFVAHHLSNAELDLLLGEIARIIRRKLIFLDPLEHKESIISNLMWRYDRGSHPRQSYAICSAIKSYFEIEHIEHYKIYWHTKKRLLLYDHRKTRCI